MKQHYLTDNHCIVGITGLRYVKKSDSTYVGSPNKYYLEFAYKGQEQRVMYPNAVERDQMFERICEQLKEWNVR